MKRRSLLMTSIAQVETAMSHILTQRANVLTKETGAIRRVRKFRGADLLQTLVFGWMQHPDASLEQLSSTAAIAAVQVSDTAVHKRFSKACASFLHAILEELLTVIVQAEMVKPPKVLRRFSAVVVEDSSTITLPEELAQLWRGCGGNQRHTAAALKLHVRWELLRGRLWGPALTEGRCSDHHSPLALEELPEGSLDVADLGYFSLGEMAQRHRQHRFTPKRLPFQAALVLLRERWQMELLDKLWKQHGQVDEWRTANPWRALCELYAKLIGVVLQHWLIVLFAWQDAQRSLVKLAQVVRDCAGSLMEALAGERPLSRVLRLVERRMHSGCQMNTRKKHPNSAQLLERGQVEWPLSWCQ